VHITYYKHEISKKGAETTLTFGFEINIRLTTSELMASLGKKSLSGTDHGQSEFLMLETKCVQ